MPSLRGSGGPYTSYAAPEPPSAPVPAASSTPPLDALARAWRRFTRGEASYAETHAAYRATGMTEHQATVALAVAIASTQPGAAKIWWRRSRRRRPPVWR